MMGWERPFLQSAVNNCTNLSGQIEDCPLFDIQSSDDFSSCKIKLPDALAKEAVSTRYASLLPLPLPFIPTSVFLISPFPSPLSHLCLTHLPGKNTC